MKGENRWAHSSGHFVDSVHTWWQSISHLQLSANVVHPLDEPEGLGEHSESTSQMESVCSVACWVVCQQRIETNASQNSWFSRKSSHSKWMFDISPVCQANLALWHAITGLITAVCSLEGTPAALAALTGPDRLIRSAGTRYSSGKSPHIFSPAHNSLSVRGVVLYTCPPDAPLSCLWSSLSTLSPLSPLFHFLVWVSVILPVNAASLPSLLHTVLGQTS